MKIVADCNIPFAAEAFADFGDVVSVEGKKITPEICRDAGMLLVRSVTKVGASLLDGSSVKFVATATIGTDHIDTAYLEKNWIGFASAPGSNAYSVAEYIIAAILRMAQLKKRSLTDMTLGIIGVGNVGRKVFKMAQALGMPCLLNDPPQQRLTDSDFYVSLDSLLQKSDIVSLHVPLTLEGDDKTVHMVNAAFLNAMKKGSILINTSRGKVVDEKAICEKRLERLGGMVVDVWENEPSINIKYLQLTDIATAHIAGYSYKGKLTGTSMIYDAACAFFFREKKWRPESVLEKLDGVVLDLSKSKQPVFDAVCAAYPIMDDDEKLRKITKYESDKQGAYFSELRQTYYKRLEFTQIAIKKDTVSPENGALLSQLGFQLRV